MYQFPYFTEQNRSTILQFMNDNTFALLIGNGAAGHPVATQIPFLLKERKGELFLQGHIMRQTDHHKAFVANPNALVVFTGAHAYVSASWYSNPHIGSTWNYMSVQVTGQIRFMEEAELVQFMRRLTLAFEGGNKQSHTFYDNLPTDFLRKMMPAIAGIEIKADRIETVFKLSQNRDKESYRNIIEKLEAQGGSATGIAEEMGKRKEALFPEGVEWDGSAFAS